MMNREEVFHNDFPQIEYFVLSSLDPVFKKLKIRGRGHFSNAVTGGGGIPSDYCSTLSKPYI